MSPLGGQPPQQPQRTAASVTTEKYAPMLALADLFDACGQEMRRRSRLGAEVLSDPDVEASAALSPPTWAEAEEEIRGATTGKHGLADRSVELDADALVVRATVLTYRWIDELQEAAYRSLGSIAGRALGYLAPEVALGGAIVTAGVIETDALDRDGVAEYLSELAETNPELQDHLASAGGLLDGLSMRSLLTVGMLAGEAGPVAARGGLRALGVSAFGVDAGAAVRDAAGALGLTEEESPFPDPGSDVGEGALQPPGSVAELMAALGRIGPGVTVRRVGEARWIGFLPTAGTSGTGQLRLVGGEHSSYADRVVAALADATAGADDARVMLVGQGQGGVVATQIAAEGEHPFTVDQVVTAGAPAAHVPRIPGHTRVLSLEDRSDPIALLGSLINADVGNRVTVVFDGSDTGGEPVYVAGGRAADEATHPQLRAEITRLIELGYLAG